MNRKTIATVICLLAISMTAFNMSGFPTEALGASESASEANSNLIIALDPDYESFDPALAYEVYAQLVLNAVYNNLVHFDRTLDLPKPDLAKSYEVAQDAMTFTFELYEDAKFASGNPVTAADVVWSFNRLINIQGNPAFLAEGIDSVEAAGDHKVVIKLKEPDGAFLSKLTYSAFAVIDSQLAIKNGATDASDAKTADTAKLWFDSHGAGSGPYLLESYTPKEQVVLVRNKEYWGPVPGSFERIVLRTIPDPGAQLMMLQKGDVDIAFNLGPENVKQLEGKEGVDVKEAQTLVISFLAMNRDKDVSGPVANPAVEKAIRLAIDYKGIQEIGGKGSSTPVSIIQLGFLGALPPLDPARAQDAEQAKKLMKEAGYGDGFKTTLNVPTISVEGIDLLTVAQKIQEDLKVIGIELEIQPAEMTQTFSLYRDGKSPFGLFYWGPDYPDANNQLAFVVGGSVAGPRVRWNESDAPELAKLAKKCMVETDPDKRAGYIREIQTKMSEDSPYIVLLQHGRQYGVRSNVKDAFYIDNYKLDLRLINKK
jgi:peptide/nickel transport system substrate-binding protein